MFYQFIIIIQVFGSVTIGNNQSLSIRMKCKITQKLITDTCNKIRQCSCAILRKRCNTSIDNRTRIITTASFQPMHIPITIWICSHSKRTTMRLSSIPPQTVLKNVPLWHTHTLHKIANYLCESVSVSIRVENGEKVPIEGTCYGRSRLGSCEDFVEEKSYGGGWYPKTESFCVAALSNEIQTIHGRVFRLRWRSTFCLLYLLGRMTRVRLRCLCFHRFCLHWVVSLVLDIFAKGVAGKRLSTNQLYSFV